MADIFDLFRRIEKKDEAQSAPISFIVAGLGNPGKEYEGTRHNVGFDAVSALAERAGVRMDSVRFEALVGDGRLGSVRVLFMMPRTYMNLSGTASAAAASFYKIPAERILVLCDDISFEPGKMRLRKKGSAGGHNGLKSIIERLGTDEFPRLRIGVGQKPHPDYDLADWVLGHFSDVDKARIREIFPYIAEACEKLAEGNFDGAMTSVARAGGKSQ